MAISKNNTRINIVISKKKKEDLDKMAKAANKSTSGFVSEIVLEYLEKIKKNKHKKTYFFDRANNQIVQKL